MSAPTLFREPAYLRFGPEHSDCPVCGSRLLVRKTRPRDVVLLDVGSIQAQETHMYCPACASHPGFRSKELSRRVAPGATFGYDVMVHIGLATFQRCRTVEELVAELRALHVEISPSEVRVQARRFILYLAQAHEESQRALKALLQKQGGYVLHLDSTCDGASSHLLSAMDGVSELVLLSVKVTSEKSEEIVPMLRRLQAAYGDPLAVVSDLSKAFLVAVKKIFPQGPHLLCHFHFLRDTGKDLLEEDYDRIRRALRTHGISALLHRRTRELRAQMGAEIQAVEPMIRALTQGIWPAAGALELPIAVAYAMLEWTLAGKQQGDGYGFPFDLPLVQFYGRLQVLSQALAHLAQATESQTKAKKSLAWKLSKDLRPVLDDPALHASIQAIHQKKEVFDQLRCALRIAQPGHAQGLNDDGQNTDMPTLEKNVAVFCEDLQRRADFTPDGPYGKMAAQIKKYWTGLFADPIRVHTPHGIIVIYPNRTNNILERLFRALNRDHRRQTGENAMRRRLDTMLGDTPLVKNLQSPVYLEILLDGSPTLEERFARIDIAQIRHASKLARQEAGRTLPGLRKILSLSTWPLDVARLWLQAKVS